MKKDTDSNYKSRSLQKYSGSHSTRKDNPRKDFPKKESSNTSYERKEPVSYGSHYESSRERNNIDKPKVRESSPRKAESPRHAPSWPLEISTDISTGRSYRGPSLRMSAGARFTVIRPVG